MVSIDTSWIDCAESALALISIVDTKQYTLKLTIYCLGFSRVGLLRMEAYRARSG